MCIENTGFAYDRPCIKQDVAILEAAYPSLPEGLIQGAYDAIMDHAFPKACTLIVIAELAWRCKEDLWGNSSFGALIPFSAMEFCCGLRRFQNPTMDVVHDAMLAFTLGERNVKLLNDHLGRYDMAYTTYHDCGCGIVTTLSADFLASKEYKMVNAFRSYGEGLGTGVVKIQDWAELGALHGHDLEQDAMDSFDRIGALLEMIPAYDHRAENNARVAEAIDFVKKLKSRSVRLEVAA